MATKKVVNMQTGDVTEVEMTAEELAALVNQPKSAEELLAEKAAAITAARATRETIINRLTGIAGRYQRAGDAATAAACDAAIVQLLGLFQLPEVVAAPDAESAKTTVLAAYKSLATSLAVSAPYAVSAFEGIDQ